MPYLAEIRRPHRHSRGIALRLTKLDPITAIRLASSIVQFVDFGSKVLVEGYGTFKSSTGTTEEAFNLEQTTTCLRDIAQRLAASNTGLAAPPSQDGVALQRLAAQCQSLAQELLSLLDELKVTGAGALRTWHAVRKSFKRLRSSEKPRKMQRQLDQMQASINTLLLSMIRNVQSTVTATLAELRKGGEDMHNAQTKTLNQLLDDVRLAADRTGHERTAMRSEIETSRQEGVAAAELNLRSVNAVLARLEDVLKERAAVNTAARLLLRVTPFKVWLESGLGIFWINGKAGSGNSTLMKFLADHEQTMDMLRGWASPKALVMASFYFSNSGTMMQKSQEGLLQSLLLQVEDHLSDWFWSFHAEVEYFVVSWRIVVRVLFF
ncbi:hypothetical protein B0A55_00086 [Friedmanniomyces simplex]|uniref:Nephrocystin 3-like N-terminal domain-containing protein n=1 Tax=Friedmanniomyces simplex TaxID=329884 RepID=A0A4V5NIM6_9PEZI|nr:hypothetical protein B0A55_00086 [Friedmanniomyces simplex]